MRCIVSPPATLTLRSGLEFWLSDRLELLLLCETVLADEYRLSDIDEAPTVVVDVGAGFGDFTVLAAHVFPEARVLAFEPEPRSFASLEHNIARNGARNVEAHRLAVGTQPSYALHRDRHAGRTRAGSEGEQLAEGRRLEAVLPPGPVDLLKIDCEGGEDDVLDSLPRSDLGRVRRLVMEYHAGVEQAAATCASLRSAGFAVSLRPDRYNALIGYLDAFRA